MTVTTAGWSEGDIPVNGINIHYYRTGDAQKPSVVLLHGFTDSGMCWRRLATDLTPDYDLVMIDAAGHGKSGGPEHGFRERAVSDVGAVIAALALVRPALVGHSMGAGTAAGVAAEYPEHIRAIALEDPGWRDATAPPVVRAASGQGIHAPIGSAEWIAWNRAFKTRTPAEQRAEAIAARPNWQEVDLPDWAEAKAQFNLAVLDAPEAGRPAWREIIGRITCPTLLLTADPARGAIVTPEIAREAMAGLRAGRLVHVPGAGHNIRREAYPPFLDAVRAFLHETATR